MAPGMLAYPSDNESNAPAQEHNTPKQTRKCRLISPEPIAVIGMGCRLPGNISKPSDLWNLLKEKRTGFKDFDSSRFNIDGHYHPNAARPGSMNTMGGHLLDRDPRLFDHTFFSMQPSEVLTMDPLQRKLVEVSYEAMESAGEPWEEFSGSRTGVYIGNFCQDYYAQIMADLDFALQYSLTGASGSILSNRINHLLNLKGPSMTIDTACASSMSALHLAVNALRAGDCDAAIVGGSNMIMGPTAQQLTVLLGALSGTSQCHTFDEAADGYSRGEGFGALYLKRYSDAVKGEYPIRAIIRGTAVNSNGKTAGISHPSADGQEALIRQAYRNAGLPTHLTGYFECHGTGTPVGDPIEVSAVGKVFRDEREDRPLLIGSVKPSLGHAEAASGITGVMKSILALENGMIPATVGIQKLNPNIDFDAARVEVVTETTPWPKDLLRRVSVNSFGFGGANGHCILDHPETMRNEGILPTEIEQTGVYFKPASRSRRLVLLPVSAHDQQALDANITALQEAIPSLSLADVAYTLSKRRSKFLYKSFAIVDSESPAEGLARQKIYSSTKNAASQSKRIGFVFTGQGAQWLAMGEGLFEYAIFRASVERQDATLASLSVSPSWKLRDLLLGRTERSVEEAEISQVVCTALQIALVDLLRSWNISPHAVVGHSSGEIATVYAAGRISLEEAIVVAYCRGRSIALNKRKGAMVAVGLGVDEAIDFLQYYGSSVTVAAINSPSSVTLSGDHEAVHQLYQELASRNIFARLLRTDENAYHSHHMIAIGERYELMLKQCLSELAIKERPTWSCHWVSSVTPYKMPKVNSSYWRQNLESTVRFSSAVERLLTEEKSCVDILIEIGPHSALRSPLKQIVSKTETDHGVEPPVYLTAIQRQEDGMQELLSLCGSLFQLNHSVDLAAVNSIDRVTPRGIDYVHGNVCTNMPTYQYSYGPALFYEHRTTRELRHRRTLHHDLLGVLQAGGAKDQPVWRNMLRLKHVPWLNDHQLIPNAVLPGAAYVCIGIEAASQFISARKSLPVAPVFKLRNISIKNALIVPDNDVGIEMVTTLAVSSFSPNWLHFTISSVDTDDTWTENASGLVSITESSPREGVALKKLDERADLRYIEAQDWYEKFTEVGLGYGKAFQGISELLTDPYKGIASAKVALNTTSGMFTGPESTYAIHPASLDICFQLALVAFHGGQTGRVKHGFIPVTIDEISIWPPSSDEKWAHATCEGHITGLRGAHADINVVDQFGLPRLELKNIGCVSYFGGTAGPGASKLDAYVRLAWKPDVSVLKHWPEQRSLSPGDNSFRQLFIDFIDLMGHRSPNMRVLQIGAGTSHIAETVLRTLGGGTATKRYSTYTVTDYSNTTVHLLKSELSAIPHVDVRRLDMEHALSAQVFDGSYDLVLVTEGLKDMSNLPLTLKKLRELTSTGGRLLLVDPNLDSEHWQPELKAAGYSGIDLEWTRDEQTPAGGLVSTAVASSKSLSSNQTGSNVLYIIYQHQISPFHEALADELRKKRIVPIIASLGSATSIPTGSRTIIAIDLESEGFIKASKEAYDSVRVLAQRVSSMLWLTKGGVIDAQDPGASIATGLFRVLSSEKLESQLGLFHLESSFLSTRSETAKLVIEREDLLRCGDSELEVALHNGTVYIPRIIYDADLNIRFQAINSSPDAPVDMPLQSQGPLSLDFSTPGLLSSAYFRPDNSLNRPLLEDFVEIKTAAISLNWKDLAGALGRNDTEDFTSDCAGVVTACGSAVTNLKPGDRVYALAWSKFGTTIRTRADLVQPMEASDSFEQMSTVPVAYCTAVYALLHLTRLRKGAKVLIQSATGGLGLAALRIAQYCSTEIYATVGSSDKAAYLRKHFNIPADRIFSSREEGGLSKMMVATGGKGFDVVLNSSSGDIMHATWRCIASRGHFIDVSRPDVQKRSTISMEVYERNATFSSFDLSTMAKEDPEFASQLIEEVGSLLRDKVIQPIVEIQTFDIAELSTALSAFSEGAHIGKFVLSYENPDSIIKTLPAKPRATFDPESEYIHVGGLGGLGRSILRWFIERGARHITVFSRSGSRNGEAKINIEDAEAAGASITLKAVDVTCKEQVEAAVAEVARRRPVRGILHAAAGFDSTVFEKMEYEEWQQGLAAKVQGTMNLHEVSLSQQLPLDFFVMTSSMQTVYAFPAQAAYCAGNVFQDAFARYRKSLGLPACAIGFGLITEITEAGKTDAYRAIMRRSQLYVHGELEFLQLLEAGFLETPEVSERSDSWTRFDNLAGAQMLAYSDPCRLAAEFKDGDNPKWRNDRKFSHIVRAMLDQLSAKDQRAHSESSQPAVAVAVDAAIKSGNQEKAITTMAKAIAAHMAVLLEMDTESIQTSRSLAAGGMDSMIAVELRSWIVKVFDSSVPLLKLLDERLSILDLAEWIVGEKIQGTT